jgi:hypothetical protein
MNHEQIERQDVVERYLLRRLPPEEAQDFEEHYLGCAECCERIREERQIITDIQRACSGWSRRKGQRRFWTLPAPAMGLAAALAAAAVYLSVMTPTVVQRREAPAAQSAALPLPVVELTTYRAGETAGQAKAGAPFRLRLDLRGLAAAGECSIEVVRESGEAAWSRSGVARTAEQTEVDLRNGLPSGAYWVRVSSEGRLLREFGLRVEP